MKQATCEERIDAQLEDTIDTLQKVRLFDGWEDMDTAERIERCDEAGVSIFASRGEYAPSDTPAFHEYGLSFDYVEPGTFNGQEDGYFRYQLSWGGPSDEFRFYVSGPNWSVHRIEYAFLDWFDGATRTLYGADQELLEDVFGDFLDFGMVESEFDSATA